MTEPLVITLPDLGEGLTEAEVVAWQVAVGDQVVTDQSLVAVETDKAVVDIPALQDATIVELLAQEGDIVPVGGALLVLGVEAAVNDPGSIVGQLPVGDSTTNKRISERTEELRKGAAGNLATPGSAHSSNTAIGRVQASPRARRRARELGVPLQSVLAAESDRVVRVGDVERQAQTHVQHRVDDADPQSHRLSGTRRSMARRMQEATRRVARASVTADANLAAWWPQPGRLMPRLLRAIARGVAANPLLNAAFDDDRLALVPQADVDIGIAIQAGRGLLVPVVRSVQTRTEDQLRDELEQLQAAAEQHRLTPQQLDSPSITLSNFGSTCGRYAELVVVPPQVAIVGVGRAALRPVVIPGSGDGAVVAAPLLPLSISFDHRALTGIEVCQFLDCLVGDLELPQ